MGEAPPSLTAMLSDATAPFVLLDDARESGVPARLYRNPVRVIEARIVAEIRPALEAVRESTAAGLHAAGFLAYEAGAAFEPSVGALPLADGPLLWFGLFDSVETIAAEDVPAHLPDPAGAWIGTPEPAIDVKVLHAKIGELTLANDFLSGALGKAGLLPSAKR